MKETFVRFSILKTVNTAVTSCKNLILNMQHKLKEGIITNVIFDSQLRRLIVQSKDGNTDPLILPKVSSNQEDGITRLKIEPLFPSKLGDLTSAFREVQGYLEQIHSRHPEAQIESVNVLDNAFLIGVNQECEINPRAFTQTKTIKPSDTVYSDDDLFGSLFYFTEEHTVKNEMGLSDSDTSHPKTENITQLEVLDEHEPEQISEVEKESINKQETSKTIEEAHESSLVPTSIDKTEPIKQEEVIQQQEELAQQEKSLAYESSAEEERKSLEDTFDALVWDVLGHSTSIQEEQEEKEEKVDIEKKESVTKQQETQEEPQDPVANQDERLLVIDGNNLMSRSYYATAYKTEEALLEKDQFGNFINGVKMFLRKLERYLQTYKPTHLVVCWDNDNPFLQNFRKQMYFPYKGLREEKPKALEQQLETIKQILDQLDIPQLMDMKGKYEADDLIGSVIKQWKREHNGPVFMVSDDKDLFQLLDKDIYQILKKGNDKEETVYSIEHFQYDYGITPQQWVDAKAILGDNSDNIPGVSGVGEKTVFELLKRFSSLEGIYNHLTELEKESRYKQYAAKFKQQREEAYLSQLLATIVTDVETPPLEAWTLNINQREKIKVFEQLGIRSKVKGIA